MSCGNCLNLPFCLVYPLLFANSSHSFKPDGHSYILFGSISTSRSTLSQDKPFILPDCVVSPVLPPTSTNTYLSTTESIFNVGSIVTGITSFKQKSV